MLWKDAAPALRTTSIHSLACAPVKEPVPHQLCGAEATVALLEVETPRDGLLLVMVTILDVKLREELLLDYGALACVQL